MGWINNRQADVLASEARDARERGDLVFVTVLHSMSAGGATDGALQVRLEWGKRIGEVEEQGWRLEHWAVEHDERGRPCGYPVFRRSALS